MFNRIVYRSGRNPPAALYTVSLRPIATVMPSRGIVRIIADAGGYKRYDSLIGPLARGLVRVTIYPRAESIEPLRMMKVREVQTRQGINWIFHRLIRHRPIVSQDWNFYFQIWKNNQQAIIISGASLPSAVVSSHDIE